MIVSARLFAAAAASGLLAACAQTAPRYETNYPAVVELRAAGLVPVRVADFTAQADQKKKIESLTVRGSSLASPYGSYTAYLAEALKDDLDRAGLLNAGSHLQIDGVLMRNTLDGSGFSVGFAELEARLTVTRDGLVAYDGTKSIRHEWPSNFVGMVAIPRAIENYPVAVRKLLSEFYADPVFTAALRKHD